MSTLRGGAKAAPRRIGVRPTAEVESAYRELTEGAPERVLPAALIDGAVDAYEWALARGGEGPITGAHTGEVPTLQAMTAEVDAASVVLDDPLCPAETEDYARGAHDVLAWICGHQ
ncbi:hypothetical protein [Streptomyces sp. NPDC047928]|uniref:hypothetical protein n=1 Tax=unclassified Streptomyces TaxID=2593676 RepID=UPI0037200D63